MKVFNIVDSNEEVTIDIQGEIGGSWWSEGVTLDSVKEQLGNIAKEQKKTVCVKINSLGGDVDEALAIYELLVKMGDRVSTECYGRCASAATIIAMAGAKRRMSRYALFLIHKCWSGVVGNENVLEEVLEEQRAINSRLVAIYTDRTGAKKEDIEALMERNNGDGAWLNAEECMQYGFISEEITATAADSGYLKSRIQNMFNIKQKPMKKSIMTLAALAAVLDAQEMDSNKEGNIIMDDETLKKINDALENSKQEIEKLKSEKAAAESDKAKAEEEKNNAETARAEAETKAQEYKDIIAKIPAADTKVVGKDPVEKSEFQKNYEDSEMFQNALEKM